MTSTDQQPTAFPWYSCDAAVRRQIFDGQAQAEKEKSMPLQPLELWLRPQAEDKRLRASIIVIGVPGLDGSNAALLYRGPYQPRLPIAGPRKPFAVISIWAIHQETGTCMAWSSKKSIPLYAERPMAVELFTRFNPMEKGWFRVYPVADT